MHQPMTATDLDDQTLEAIARIAQDRAPSEACGIIVGEHDGLPARVVEMPNRHLEHHHNFLFTSDDILTVLKQYPDPQQRARELVVWHSHTAPHPIVGVGPSKNDLDNKIGDVHYLVVTLTLEGPLATWY